MKQTLGNLERQLFAYAQMRGLRTLRTGDLTKALGISAKQESKLFTRLSKAGMIAQVRRGLYLVPERLPLGGRWSPDEGLALSTLFDAQEAATKSAVQMPLTVMASTNRFPPGCMSITIESGVTGASDRWR